MFVKLHLIVWKSFSFKHPSPPQLCSSILPPGIWSLENYGCVMNWPIVAVTPKQLYDNETITVFLFISQLIERKLVFSAGVWSQVRVRKDLWVTDFYLRVDFCLCLRTLERNHSHMKMQAFPLQVHFNVNQTHFHMKGFAQTLGSLRNSKWIYILPTNLAILWSHLLCLSL